MSSLIRILMALAIVALIPGNVRSCEPTYAEVVDMAQRDRTIEENYVSRLFDESDYVLVGRVLDVRDSGDPNYAQIATISIEKSLRGPGKEVLSFLMYKRDKSTTPINDDEVPPLESIPVCGEPYDPSKEQPYLLEGFRALVYVKDGILKRATSFPVEPEPLFLNARTEIEYLQGDHRVRLGNED
jgi:hypothetical protein